jgi:glycyl-tRNA synthetase beta chain
MPDLLFELFSEEIPARMQKNAERDLADLFTAAMAKEGFADCKVTMFSTPRRVALVCNNLPAAQPDVTTELKGPKTSAPEAALEGFLKKTGLKKTDLMERDGVYFASVHQKGKPTAELLKLLIEAVLQNFPWPKSMRWGSGSITWVRPLHSMLCIFDGKVVPVEFAGVKAGNTTSGHRFLAPEKITITNSADYEKALEKAHVIATREKRKAEILKQAEKVAASKNLVLTKDEGLLEEVTGLVEWPMVLMGTIDAQFMDLPREVLVSEMRAHQKYFALENKDGSFSDKFLITANTETKDGGKAIIAGNERVLRARLADGRFFWDQDRKKSLDQWAEGLKAITFHAKLGTVAEKVERITARALVLTAFVPGADKKLVERAASLCKADLTTGMVGEFAELQGVMGRYYATAQKEKPEVADAIRDHYKPQGPNDSVPKQAVSICVALADKLDTMVSMFAIGEKPTGSKDPFALRRAALGVIRIILENNIRLPLKSCFAPPAVNIALNMANEKLIQKTEVKLHQAAASHKVGKYVTVNETAYQDVGGAVPSNLTDMLYEFFIDRLKVQMKDSGIRHDVINAVVADGDDDLVRIVARAKALQDFLSTDDGANLLTAYKRAANILVIEEKKDKAQYTASSLQSTSLKETEEKALATALSKQSVHIDNLRAEEQFVEAMKLLAGLRSTVDHFFDKIMVNCDDKDLRANRLRLLASIRDSMDGVARFSAVEG